jgi:uncharacterized protein YfeS|tara:strand:- start:84 stop:293 length:210 start_codon:yes stop_codon:yes gene_type:complete
MSNIIEFPSWLIEKEREVKSLEAYLKVKERRLEINERKIADERIVQKTRVLLAFCLGLLVMGIIVLPLL